MQATSAKTAVTIAMRSALDVTSRRLTIRRVNNEHPNAPAGPAYQPHYQPYYCEENMWLLAQDPRCGDGERLVALITNPSGQFAMWHQRPANGPGEPLLWDYHVVLLVQNHGWQVWDFECDLGLTVPALDWCNACFPYQHTIRPAYHPHFRVMSAANYVATLRSDRSHMRDAKGNYNKPPPPWSPPGGGSDSNLAQFIDLRQPLVGEIYDLAGLKQKMERS